MLARSLRGACAELARKSAPMFAAVTKSSIVCTFPWKSKRGITATTHNPKTPSTTGGSQGSLLCAATPPWPTKAAVRTLADYANGFNLGSKAASWANRLANDCECLCLCVRVLAYSLHFTDQLADQRNSLACAHLARGLRELAPVGDFQQYVFGMTS